jgi:hypothetical protein
MHFKLIVEQSVELLAQSGKKQITEIVKGYSCPCFRMYRTHMKFESVMHPANIKLNQVSETSCGA